MNMFQKKLAEGEAIVAKVAEAQAKGYNRFS